jgi:hypothetical protein
MTAKNGIKCPCGSGLRGRRQWSQGLPDKIACPACFVSATKTVAKAPLSGKKDQRNAAARRKLEALREARELAD